MSPKRIGAKTDPDFLLAENSFVPENTELNGSKFLLGNGYMGYRGTLEEYNAVHQVACTLAGVYDQAGEAWREPVNAPNGLHTLLFVNDQPLHAAELLPAEHQQWLDIGQAVHGRETCFLTGENNIRIASERFLSLDNVHLIGMRYSFRCAAESRVILLTGIDGAVWDINGPHLKAIRFQPENGTDARLLCSIALTNEGDTIAVAEALDCNFGTAEIRKDEKGIYHRLVLQAEAGREYCFHKYVAVYTSKDDVTGPAAAAQNDVRVAAETGFAELYRRHAHFWRERWQKSDVVIGGDPEAQFALRYSIYQLFTGAPVHSETSIPARGLSGQTYKGAIFWDTELFMLPFFIFVQPQLARNLIKYRVHTLDGARRKAAAYGYRGAFYAWESQERGHDACTLFNVTDVFTGRPLRTYFRDKQIHISADVVYGIWQYYLMTGDESIFAEGAAAVILECARFFYSYAYFKKDKNRFEILDVTGPDEYHERVSNNAFTNQLVKLTLEVALWVLDYLAERHPELYRTLLEELHFHEEIPHLREMKELLYVPAPDANSYIIEQFDGYRRLEDVSLAELKARVKNPNEYWGGGNGLATTTQILKQADVAALLHIFKDRYCGEVKKANWEYYEPRTEHGSSLSSCIYAMAAADIAQPDWAYPYFLKTATLDLSGDYKRYVGTLYIGGTHPAANGGAWMTAVLGFGGLYYDGRMVTLKPALPRQWQSLSFHFEIRGQRFRAALTPARIQVSAAPENTEPLRFQIHGKCLDCGSGAEIAVELT